MLLRLVKVQLRPGQGNSHAVETPWCLHRREPPQQHLLLLLRLMVLLLLLLQMMTLMMMVQPVAGSVHSRSTTTNC
jgi:hypothetical protein